MFKCIVGPVKSEKSKVLIERYNSDSEHTLLFSPYIAQENGMKVKSRYGTEVNSIPITSITEVITLLKDYIKNGMKVRTILIDEIQFVNILPSTLRDVVNYLLELNIDLIVYGLDMDYKGMPFSSTSICMSLADSVIKVNGYCDICKSHPSTMSLRLDDGKVVSVKDYKQLIQLDGESNTTYLSVCRECYNKEYKKLDSDMNIY